MAHDDFDTCESFDTCPQCDGEPTYLGNLGGGNALRCRDCGWVYYQRERDDDA